jgi:hypothetical protein
MKQFRKDPQDILDYSCDWTAWLAAAADPPDTVTDSSWSVSPSPGLLIGDGTNGAPVDSFSDVSSTVWLKDGAVGEFYRVTNHITTAGDREADQTFVVQIQQR